MCLVFRGQLRQTATYTYKSPEDIPSGALFVCRYRVRCHLLVLQGNVIYYTLSALTLYLMRYIIVYGKSWRKCTRGPVDGAGNKGANLDKNSHSVDV